MHKGSLNVSIQENNYKTLTCWYRTPAILNKHNPSSPNKCWRCAGELGILLHILWSCPLIQPFWSQVRELTESISTYALDHIPAQCLFHHFDIPAHLYRKTLILPLINVAEMCVPRHWGSPNIPTISEWFKQINRIAEMEELAFIARDSPAQYSKTWAWWNHFRTTKRYLTLMD